MEVEVTQNMKFHSNVMYVSSLGLGVEIETSLYIRNNELFIQSEMSGKMIPVKWLEEGKTVQPVF